MKKQTQAARLRKQLFIMVLCAWLHGFMCGVAALVIYWR